MAGSLPTIETFICNSMAPESSSAARIITALSCQPEWLGRLVSEAHGVHCGQCLCSYNLSAVARGLGSHRRRQK